jgi:hypothetical protein
LASLKAPVLSLFSAQDLANELSARKPVLKSLLSQPRIEVEREGDVDAGAIGEKRRAGTALMAVFAKIFEVMGWVESVGCKRGHHFAFLMGSRCDQRLL